MSLNTALIVDDSRTSAAVLGKMLARHQLSSDKVTSGEEALAYLVASTPDVIFMDHMMPGMDGFQAVKAIKQQPELRDIPIVMYTSKEGDIYSGQARALGAVGVLQKPAAEHDVADILDRLRLERAQRRALRRAANDAVLAAEPDAEERATALPGWLSATVRPQPPRTAPLPHKLHRALIVDDSRTSAAVLGKMLVRHEVGSDKVTSGEECLAYLASANPDIIFMDHMMPGMDGFQAVKAIKQQTKLRAIPIVMYTSQSGDQYIGQARALGAVGVLKKPALDADLAAILDRVRRDGGVRPEREVEAATKPAAQAAVPQAAALPAVVAAPPPRPVAAATPGAQRRPRRLALAAGGVVALLAAALLASLSIRPRLDQAALLDALTQLGNQRQEVEFGAVPFSDERYEIVSGIARVLSLAGLKARIELRSHVGEFCRVYGGGVSVLPPRDTPIERCEMIGFEPTEAQRLAAGQSPRFRDFAAQLGELAPGVELSIVPVGIFEPRLPYPPDAAITIAGDWNAIAAKNNRVELRLVPTD